MYALFELQNSELVLSEEAYNIKEFKDIIRRDRGSDGDAQGRKKLRAMAELNYAYQMASYKGHPFKKGLSPKEAHEWSKRNARLPDDWSADEKVKKVILFIREDERTPSMSILQSLKRGLTVSEKAIRLITRKVEKQLEEVERAINNDEDDYITDDNGNKKKNPNSASNKIVVLMKDIKELLELGKNIPSSIKSVSETEEQLRIETNQNSKVRGKRDLGNREG